MGGLGFLPGHFFFTKKMAIRLGFYTQPDRLEIFISIPIFILYLFQPPLSIFFIFPPYVLAICLFHPFSTQKYLF